MNKKTKEKIMQFINNVLGKRNSQKNTLLLSTFSKVTPIHAGHQSLGASY